MGQRFTITQNNFSHGMQSDIRDNNLVGQNQAFGASLIKHADIYTDPHKLTPLPSFERFNTDAEKAYEIVALGGDDGNTVYGAGKAMTNWYSPDWQYRVTLTPANTGECDYIVVDLSQLPAEFWDNVAIDGSDIKATYEGERFDRPQKLLGFNRYENKGYIFLRSSDIRNIDIYWGTETGEAIEDTYVDLCEDNTDNYYPLTNESPTGVDYNGGINLDGADNFVDGKYGEALSNDNADSDGVTINSDDQGAFSFMFKFSADVGSYTFIDLPSVEIRSNIYGQLYAEIDENTGNAILTSSTQFRDDQWHYATISYDDNNMAWMYVDGVLEDSVSTSGRAIDFDSQQVLISTNEHIAVQHIAIMFGPFKDTAQMEDEGEMHADSASFFTVGSVVEFDEITPEYGYIALWKKDIDGDNWSPVYSNGWLSDRTGTEVFAYPGFIGYSSSTYFFLTCRSDYDQLGSGIKNIYGGTATSLADFDPEVDPIETSNHEMIPYLQFPIDKEYYFPVQGSVSVYSPYGKTFKYTNQSGDEITVTYPIGFSSAVFDPYPQPMSLVPYGYSLAMTGTRREQGYIEVWDLTNLDPDTVVRLGTGDAKVISNIKGALITTVNNYIDDTELSRGNPTLDFRIWEGQDNVRSLQSFEYDVNTTEYPNPYQSVVHNVRADLNDASVFYAEPKSEHAGFWAVGSGVRGVYGVSIMFDTTDLGYPMTYISKGNNLIFVNTDLEMYKVSSGSYTQDTVFESMLVDAGVVGREKTITALQVTLDEALPVGQTVTLEYKTDDQDWVTVGTCDTGERETEFALAGGSEFNSFKEMQIRTTSTGGGASITSWSLKGEYTDEMV